MIFQVQQDRLLGRQGAEHILIEAWGRNALRVRAGLMAFTDEYSALSPLVTPTAVRTERTEDGAWIENGMLRCFVHNNGWMAFYRADKLILKEYYRDFSGANAHSPSMKLTAREYKPIRGGDYALTLRFESRSDEKIFGMGQYQQDNFDLKGCVLELAQRNSQVSVPFYLSNLGYGFLWNTPAIGEASFGTNFMRFTAESGVQIDYWLTADETPHKVMETYTGAVGRAPAFPDDMLGLWQSKLRYRTQDEVLSVAREYHRRGIPLDVIVIDFFHWVRQGDWSFDKDYFPDPAAMCRELHEMGTRCMVSIWPTVDRKSVNFQEMRDLGLLVRTERGSMQCFDFQGDTVIYDATNPEARAYIWQKAKENYYDLGVDSFWLDEAEPEFAAYDFDHFRYSTGSVLRAGNAYPMYHAKAFYDGLIAAGEERPVSLLRSAWVGSQKFGAVLWSGDVLSNFQSLRDQLTAGLHVGIAGIPWWTTDTGGFFGDVTAPGFNELLIRWFEFSAFSPVLRLHGDRGPHDIPNLSDLDYGGGFSPTGRPNELWSYGEEVYRILKKYVDIRLGMKDYLRRVFREASETGAPVMRPLFFEFPHDKKAWEIGDEYMFGGDYLVAPVLEEGVRERSVYLPQGSWRLCTDGTLYEGGRAYLIPAPLDVIPVFSLLRANTAG